MVQIVCHFFQGLVSPAAVLFFRIESTCTAVHPLSIRETIEIQSAKNKVSGSGVSFYCILFSLHSMLFSSLLVFAVVCSFFRLTGNYSDREVTVVTGSFKSEEQEEEESKLRLTDLCTRLFTCWTIRLWLRRRSFPSPDVKWCYMWLTKNENKQTFRPTPLRESLALCVNVLSVSVSTSVSNRLDSRNARHRSAGVETEILSGLHLYQRYNICWQHACCPPPDSRIG